MAGLTLVFTTYNGAATLPRLLDGLAAQHRPAGDWEIVAVDDGSTDASAAILRAQTGRLPLTVLEAPHRGKSAALNLALERLAADLVVLTDDDVAPPPDWLVSLQALAGRRPGYDIFGGAIRPVWPGDPPAWVFGLALQDYYAWTHFEEGPAPAAAVWGPNMAARRCVFEGRRFLETIGPDGRAGYAVGSETEFLIRAAADGHRCWHDPAIVVGHLIKPRQLTPESILQRARNQARGISRMQPDPLAGRRRVLGRPAEVWGRYLAAQANLVRARLTGGFEQRLRAQIAVRTIEGDLIERLSRNTAALSG